MLRLSLVTAVACAALAAWLSQGTLAFTGAGASRIALLPVSASALSIVAIAAACALAGGRAAGSAAPFILLLFLFLPWLPGRTPDVFQMWAGAMPLLVWLAIALAFAPSPRLVPALVATRPRTVAGVLAAIVFSIAAWQVAPSVPGGDEPHYLVITQSLLSDFDLKIENNHRQGDYRAYYAGSLAPDFIQRGRDGEIYSIHAPGVSALVAPAFAVAGYRGVVLFLLMIAVAGSVLSWHLAWLATGRTDAAWFGWAAVTFSTTAIFHSFTVYPDLPGAVLTLTGVWALLRARDEARDGSEGAVPWFLHGLALAALPWMHTRFALLAGSLGALVLLRLASTRNPAGKAVAFLAAPAVSALAWAAYFVAIYGTPDPSAPYGAQPDAGSLAFIPGGLAGLLFDQRFGLLAYAPVLVYGLGGFVVMLRRPDRRLALELLFVMIPYLLVVTHFAMWWGGHSAPARFLVPVLPLLSITAAFAWTSIASRATRATAWGAMAFTVFASAVLVLVGGGRLAYNTRDSYAQWLDWLNPSLDLGHGLPAFWRGREHELFRDTAVWIAALAAAFAILRSLERAHWLRGRIRYGTAAAGAYACAAMVAITVVWQISGASTSNATPAQLQLLRRLGSERRVVTFEPGPFRRVSPSAVPALMTLRPEPATGLGGAGRNDRPLFMVPTVPAGTYELRASGPGGDGWLMIGIGRDQFALRTEQLSDPPAPIVLHFPVDVRAIVVRGDEQARRAVRRLAIAPTSLVAPGSALTREYAKQAVRYGASTAYFLDDRSFPEPEAFWVGGARRSQIVLQPDTARPVASIVIRNAPVDNRVLIEAGGWREEMRLGPGEERRVDIPLDTRRGATLISFSTSSGFRPSEVEPGSQDGRFLGVWIRVGF